MQAQLEKPKENKSRSMINSIVRKKSIGKQGYGVVDNRIEALAQRKLDEIGNNRPIIQKHGIGIDTQAVQRMIAVGETTLGTLDQVKNMMASDEQIGWDNRWTNLVQLFLAEGRSFDSPKELESILEIYIEHDLRTLIADSLEVEWNDDWDEAVEMIAKYPIYTFQSIPELIQLLNRLTYGLDQRQEIPVLKERPSAPSRNNISTTWYVGMTTAAADKIIRDGFKMRVGDPVSVASKSNMARNGIGLYLSASKNTAKAFGAVAARDGPVSVFEITGLNVNAFTGIEHQMNDTLTTHLVEQGIIRGSKKGRLDTKAREELRSILIRDCLGGDSSRVDYVSGKTEGKGTWELVLVSMNIGNAIAEKFKEENRTKFI